MEKIKVKQVRSPIGQPTKTRKILWGLGLRKMNAERTLPDNNCVRGMINKVRHLVEFSLVKS